ncbi:CheY-like chemotaxis protein [Salinibacter ruber]|uniref:hypothetical protein n=1 Tax=Salinibacter ruber TaxID=146919 RepID=UPI0021696893|nr:hypothetical protein [Salinibacter ruber]MCS4169381.1 CheY-like chemotaxis protein [Salinibacter ruber]
MKPILVVDDRSRFPSVDAELSELVECHTRFHDRSAVDFSRYATAFVHGRNDARQWAEDSLDQENDLVFVFSGDEDQASEFAGVYTLPRPVFTNRFASFLRRYAAGNSIGDCAEVFSVEQVEEKGDRSGDLIGSAEELPDSIKGTVAFYLQEQGQPEGAEHAQLLPIRRRERETARTINFDQTLAPLRDLSEPHLIRLGETFLSEGDGLDLLLHLRLEARHLFSRFPVAISLRRSVEAWVRQHPRYSIIATEGVLVDQPRGSEDEEGLEELSPLTVGTQRRILERLPLSGEGLSGRHDLANEWGPVQLWNGLSKLQQSREEMPDWARQNYQSLRRRRYYKYLFALLTLRNAEAAEGGRSRSKEEESPQRKWDRWREFLDDRAQSLQVLLIDDEVDKGWDFALNGLFDEHSDAGTLEAPFTPDDFENDLDAVREKAGASEWDLVLVDLRLTKSDQGVASRHAEQLTGMRLIRFLKENRPDLPVVAVTASNKAWTAKALSAAGADGYWVKENPRHGVDLQYTVDNAADLLETVRAAVAPHDDARPVWTLVEQVEDLLGNRSAVYQWVPLTEHQKPEEVRNRLRATIRRLRRAYGYLVADFTAHQEAEFSFWPYDLAFLTLWSIVNEIVALHFKDPDYRYKPLHRTSGELRYTFFDPGDSRDRPYWVIKDGSVMHASPPAPDSLEEYVRPSRDGRPDWPSLSVENPRVAWLLHRAGRSTLAGRFDDLRELRNDLEEEHGEATRARHADLKDVQDMVRVWRCLLSA